MQFPKFLFCQETTTDDPEIYVVHTGTPQFVAKVVETEDESGAMVNMLFVEHFMPVNINDPEVRKLERTALEYIERAMKD